jgi:hypothetical protein
MKPIKLVPNSGQFVKSIDIKDDQTGEPIGFIIKNRDEEPEYVHVSDAPMRLDYMRRLCITMENFSGVIHHLCAENELNQALFESQSNAEARHDEP